MRETDREGRDKGRDRRGGQEEEDEGELKNDAGLCRGNQLGKHRDTSSRVGDKAGVSSLLLTRSSEA